MKNEETQHEEHKGSHKEHEAFVAFANVLCALRVQPFFFRASIEGAAG
jgi:hypothetical protein